MVTVVLANVFTEDNAAEGTHIEVVDEAEHVERETLVDVVVIDGLRCAMLTPGPG